MAETRDRAEAAFDFMQEAYGAKYDQAVKTKGCFNRRTVMTMVFKLCQSASNKWRRLGGPHQLVEIINGVKFKDGEKLVSPGLMDKTL